ncbi:MAG: phage Gp37/Gp68 family protein [Succinivibrionaceae bacterium]|nr:phage Gp37/Gp68 family protein [Succinivibrionaceae bacterium]
MHDTWNPWHGCRKVSEGCRNCYMFFLDRLRERDGADIYRTKAGFRYPLARDRQGNYKVRPGETLRVCMTSDFFLEEADPWRDEAWEIIRQRPDVIFFLLTKRPARVASCLPPGWGEGWEHVFLNVSCENQRRADERLGALLGLPFRHKGVMCAPLLGPISLRRYLAGGQIEQVLCDGENYAGARECDCDWVSALSRECREHQVTFDFISTGEWFRKGGRLYHIRDHRTQSTQAHRSGLSYVGRPIDFRLCDATGRPLGMGERHWPLRVGRCLECGMSIICNGCTACGKCGEVPPGHAKV